MATPELTTTTSGYFVGYTLADLEKIILWEVGNVIGTSVSFDRYPRWLIRRHLTDRQNEFVFYSKCLKKFALIRAKEGYRQYKLPHNCMDMGLIAVKYYSSSSSYDDLDIVDLDYMNENVSGYLVESNGTPQYAFMGDEYGNIPMLEVSPPPDSDGTSYSVSPDSGITIGGDLPGTTSNLSGTATGGSATTLVDTNTDFTSLGLVSGMAVNNVTDGSSAVIQSIATNTITFASALTGGSDNTFEAGDSYLILAGEYGVLVDWENSDRVIFASEMGALANITVPAGNFRVDYVPYPITFPEEGNDSQIPEIPKIYHKRLAFGVVADLLRTFHEDSQEFKRAQYYEALFQQAIAEAKGGVRRRPFDRKGASFRPAYNTWD